jgi:perosamine synthetase
MPNEPATRKQIPVYAPSIGEREQAYVNECLKTGWVSSRGHFVKDFEDSFAAYIGAKHAVAVCNGTVALHSALLALGIGRGDEVIVPTFTYVASVNAIKYVDATPVFAESHPAYWNLDPTKIEERITPRTRAIMVVHLYGHPCDMDPILEIAQKHDLFVIEDAAEAHGAEYKGRRVGNFGDVNTFSFFGNKIITTGEGGMVVTNDDALADLCVRLKGQGVSRADTYWHDILGYNYRMTNIAAAIGLAQLERVAETIRRKREIAHLYKSQLDAVEGVVLQGEAPWALNVYWMFSILVPPEKRERLRDYLRQQGVETRPFFHPAHTMPIYAEYRHQQFPVAQEIASRGINLPSGPTLIDDEIKYVCGAVKRFLREP